MQAMPGLHALHSTCAPPTLLQATPAAAALLHQLGSLYLNERTGEILQR